MATVDLRALTRADFDLLGRWLVEPEVATWWHDDPSPEALDEQYGPSIDGTDPTRVLVASHDGLPVGLVQWFRWADEPGYLAEVTEVITVPVGAVGLDYLIGSAADRGRGLGRAMITAALAQAHEAGATAAVVPVHADNLASCTVLERSGFVVVAEAPLEPDNPAHDHRHLIYRRDLPAQRNHRPPGE